MKSSESINVSFVKSLESFVKSLESFVKSLESFVKSLESFVKSLESFVKSLGSFDIQSFAMSLFRNSFELSSSVSYESSDNF